MILIPGITGSSSDIYILNMITKAIDSGIDCVVMNHRGSKGSKLSSNKLYSAGCSGDINDVIGHVTMRYPEAKIYAIGFSLGANLLTKYLGENRCEKVSKAICISNPWDFKLCNATLPN